MAADASELHAQRTWRGDVFHDADGDIFFLKQRPLFDVQLDESGIAVFLEAHSGQVFLSVAGFIAPIIECLPVAVAKGGGISQGECSGH